MLASKRHQDNTCDHVYGDIRQIYELYARSSDSVRYRGVLLTLRNDRLPPWYWNLLLCVRRAAPCTVGRRI
jgi:hypothetical protein